MAAADRVNGNVADIAFGPTLTSTTSPSAAEVDAMVRIECGLVDGPNTPRNGSTIDLTALCDEQSRQKRGTIENAPITATLYREDDGTDAYWAAFDDATASNQYLIVSRFGFASGTPAATDVADVYTVQVMKREPSTPVRNEAQRFMVELAVIDVQYDAVLAA